MGASKTENKTLDESAADETKQSYSEQLKYLNPIAKPIATKKLTRKIYKCINKAKKNKNTLDTGIKSVQKALRRGSKGMLIIGGDVHPIDMFCHLPVVCEEKNIPYCYVPSCKDLGAAASRQSMVCTLIRPQSDYQKTYDECLAGINELPPVR